MNENNFPMMDVQNIREQEGEVKVFTLNDYQKLAGRTAKNDMPLKDALLEAALGCSGESGEISDEIKKIVYHEHPINKEKLLKEAGDVMWYIARLCTVLGVTLEEVATMNIDKLMKRYKDGFSQEASVARVDMNE